MVIGVAVLATALLVPRLVPGAAGPARTEPGSPAAGAPVLERREAGEALVHVAGAVRRPGVYRVGGGGRVRDAIRRAGGAVAKADLDAINLAARVTDGQQVVVPRRAGVPGAAGAAATAPVSLGSATAEQLDTLDGVGPVMAGKIVEWRTARGGVGSVDELDEIPGIGPKKLEALRDQLAP